MDLNFHGIIIPRESEWFVTCLQETWCYSRVLASRKVLNPLHLWIYCRQAYLVSALQKTDFMARTLVVKYHGSNSNNCLLGFFHHFIIFYCLFEISVSSLFNFMNLIQLGIAQMLHFEWDHIQRIWELMNP
jgi:uncharacterized membrane protein